jgi:hypothetical protein
MGGQKGDAHQITIFAEFGQHFEGRCRHRFEHRFLAAFVMDDGHPESPGCQIRPQMPDTEVFDVGVVDDHGMFHDPVMYQKPRIFSTHMTAR